MENVKTLLDAVKAAKAVKWKQLSLIFSAPTPKTA